MTSGDRWAPPSARTPVDPPPPPGDPRRPPFPPELRLRPDRGVRRFADGAVVAGGHPGRLISLRPAGADALDRLLAGEPEPSPPSRRLARRLVDAGIAHPRRPDRPPTPVPGPSPSDVTVVVPARDRPEALDRCLGALGRGVAVVVVDDGSRDPTVLGAVCDAHGAPRIRREENGGPGAARDSALAVVDTPFVAFVDSDCIVPPGWLVGLTWHFADPTVAAVAPRIRPRGGPGSGGPGRETALARYRRARSPLDLGTDPSPVGPGRAVRYVPTATLLVRVDAVGCSAFDPDLRVGEDVDLVWRLARRGWSVRYEPDVEVDHEEPGSWAALLRRRFRYGTSAGPLARRHGARVAALELRPAPTLAAVAALAGRPGLAALVVGASAFHLFRRTRPFGVPPAVASRWAVGAASGAALGIAHWSTMLAWPAAGVLVGGRRTPASRALALAGLVALPALVEWYRRRPDLDPVRWTLAAVADDAAYGLGVWEGSLRSRTAVPLLPARALPARADPETPGPGG